MPNSRITVLSRKKTVWPQISAEFQRITCYSYLVGISWVSFWLNTSSRFFEMFENLNMDRQSRMVENSGKMWIKSNWVLEWRWINVARKTAQFHMNAKESNWETPPQNNVGQPWIVKCQWMRLRLRLRLLLHHCQLQSNTIHTIQLQASQRTPNSLPSLHIQCSSNLPTLLFLIPLTQACSRSSLIQIFVQSRILCWQWRIQCETDVDAIQPMRPLRSHIWPNSWGGVGEGLEWRAFWTTTLSKA